MTDALQALADVLEDLAQALAQGRAESVQAIEPRLADAVAALTAASQTLAGARRGPADRELAETIRARIAVCRRLGGSVPALMSIMFPGQLLYGRDGRRRGALPVRPAVAQVI